jgi:uncharacterized coiled-coil protein SlyX
MAIFTEAEAKFDTIDAKLTNLYARVEVLDEKTEAKEIDYDSLASEIDYDELGKNIDLHSLVGDLDYSNLAGELDYRDLASNIADSLDLSDIADKIDLDDLASKVSDEFQGRLSEIPAVEEIEKEVKNLEDRVSTLEKNTLPVVEDPDKLVVDAVEASKYAQSLLDAEGRIRQLGRTADEQAAVIGTLNSKVDVLQTQVAQLTGALRISQTQNEKFAAFFKAFGALAGEGV